MKKNYFLRICTILTLVHINCNAMEVDTSLKGDHSLIEERKQGSYSQYTVKELRETYDSLLKKPIQKLDKIKAEELDKKIEALATLTITASRSNIYNILTLANMVGCGIIHLPHKAWQQYRDHLALFLHIAEDDNAYISPETYGYPNITTSDARGLPSEILKRVFSDLEVSFKLTSLLKNAEFPKKHLDHIKKIYAECTSYQQPLQSIKEVREQIRNYLATHIEVYESLTQFQNKDYFSAIKFDEVIPQHEPSRKSILKCISAICQVGNAQLLEYFLDKFVVISYEPNDCPATYIFLENILQLAAQYPLLELYKQLTTDKELVLKPKHDCWLTINKYFEKYNLWEFFGFENGALDWLHIKLRRARKNFEDYFATSSYSQCSEDIKIDEKKIVAAIHGLEIYNELSTVLANEKKKDHASFERAKKQAENLAVIIDATSRISINDFDTGDEGLLAQERKDVLEIFLGGFQPLIDKIKKEKNKAKQFSLIQEMKNLTQKYFPDGTGFVYAVMMIPEIVKCDTYVREKITKVVVDLLPQDTSVVGVVRCLKQACINNTSFLHDDLKNPRNIFWNLYNQAASILTINEWLKQDHDFITIRTLTRTEYAREMQQNNPDLSAARKRIINILDGQIPALHMIRNLENEQYFSEIRFEKILSNYKESERAAKVIAWIQAITYAGNASLLRYFLNNIKVHKATHNIRNFFYDIFAAGANYPLTMIHDELKKAKANSVLTFYSNPACFDVVIEFFNKHNIWQYFGDKQSFFNEFKKSYDYIEQRMQQESIGLLNLINKYAIQHHYSDERQQTVLNIYTEERNLFSAFNRYKVYQEAKSKASLWDVGS